MERPKYLRSCTVVELRKEIKENLERLHDFGQLVIRGFCNDFWDEYTKEHESITNQVMTEYILQGEYLRERESNNWGWDRKIIDFSKI